jgi:peptide/nickel transport system permease protein
MRRFIIRRFVFALVSIVVATMAVFLLSRASGDPLLLYATSGYGLTAEGEAALRKRLALDRPVPVLLQRLPATLHLGATAFILSFVVGIPLGILSAVKRGSIWDYLGRFFALLGQAVPQFWLGLVLIMLFAVKWQIFPAGLKGDNFWDVKFLVLPTITLASGGFAFYMRITRTAMLEVLDSEYVRLARAKGVGNTKVIWKHAFKNALIQPLTGMTLGLTFFLTGSVLVEKIFAWPGMGEMAIVAVNNNDFPVLQGVVFFFTILFVGMTFITDLLYAYIDPRIRYE